MTLTMTLDRVILHSNSLISTYEPNFIETEETFCGRTDERTYVQYGRTFETHFIRSTQKSGLRRVDLKIRKMLFNQYLFDKNKATNGQGLLQVCNKYVGHPP